MQRICRVNCCLCGAPIDETLAQRWPEWMGHFRAVCILDKQWTSAFVSRVGRRHPYSDFVPNPLRRDDDDTALGDSMALSIEPTENIEADYMDIDLHSSSFSYPSPYDDGERIWGFPFHCSCWDLLNARRETRGAAHLDPQVVFDVLRSFPRHRLVEFGHDYGGVAVYDFETDDYNIADPSRHPCSSYFLPGEEPRLVYDRTNRALLNMQKQDPMCVIEIPSLFKGERSPGSPVPQRQIVPPHNDTVKSGEIFGKLPIELLQSILIELSSPEVITLKRSSRVFQYLPLPDTFWRSRFLDGREFGHVFEALNYFQSCSGGWKAIYQLLKSMSKSPGLVNRRRIWDLARILDDLVEKRLENQICSGTIIRSYFEPVGVSSYDTVWLEGYRCLRPLPTGCRDLYTRIMPVPRDAALIYVSLVTILGKTYVSGLRFPRSRGSIRHMGYVRPGNEVSLTWNVKTEPYRAMGFHLALDQHGIRGLCVVSGANELSGWAGNHEDIPKRRLVVPADQPDTITKLKGRFDALKLVSLCLSTRRGSSTKTSLTPAAPSLRDTALWFPVIPEPNLSFSGITAQDLRLDDYRKHEKPLSMLIFRTRNGAYLNHIARLKVLSQDYVVMGFEVTFENPIDGKDSVLVGSSKPYLDFVERARDIPPEALQESEMTFDISAGEELIALDVLQRDYVLCFKVYTNFGRVVELPSPRRSYEAMDARAKDDGKIISVMPGSGKVVGFLVRAGSTGLQNLGLVHMEFSEKDPVDIRGGNIQHRPAKSLDLE